VDAAGAASLLLRGWAIDNITALCRHPGHGATVMREGTPGEVLRAFLRLGVSSFGGPIAHLGYFRIEFVERRRWLTEPAYADLVGLCQFLPGPASSQVGFALGLRRAGWLGGLAAWAGFTLPSALLLVLFAYGAAPLEASPLGAGLLHGLKLVAVAIVAQAVRGMATTLCPDPARATIGAAAAILALCAPVSAGQLGAIVLGALAGLVWCRSSAGAELPPAEPMPVSRKAGVACLAAFAALLVLAYLPSGMLALPAAFYRSGALVFGGGHVVPGWVGDDTFLAGYGATQAMPGPLFTFAAYLGAVAGGVPGAAIALIAIFLPGLLLLTGALPFWTALRSRPLAQAALRGVNAAVVGILAAALYDPVWTSAVHGAADAAIALAGFILLVVWRAPPLAVVALSAGLGMAWAS
jgi:chromate transporter